MGEWAKRVVARHWCDAGLPVGQHITVDDYLNAIWARGFIRRPSSKNSSPHEAFHPTGVTSKRSLSK
jgi:hypothetical protein